MYSRREDNSNINESYGRSLNGNLAQGELRKFDASTKSGCQQMNNGNSKMDFSIFHGQNSNLQRTPVQSNKVPDQTHQQSNTFKDLNGRSHKQNCYGEKYSLPQTEQFKQQSTLRNSSAFATPMIPQTSQKALSFMGVPKPKTYTSKTQNSTTSSLDMERMGTQSSPSTRVSSSRARRYGDSAAEQMCVFTGTVQRVIKWGKIFQNHFCYFEVIAGVVSIADGKVQFEKIMLLRDSKGPILQVTYYSIATHINIEDFHLGQMLRVVGRIIGSNIMSAITIRAATSEEIEILPRMYHVNDRAVSNLCGSN